MRTLLVLTAALLISACSEGFVPRKPSDEVIDRLERRLAQDSCVGGLSHWERHYTFASEPFIRGLFGWRNRWYDYSRIDIDLREAGFEEFKGGRHIHSRLPPHSGSIDDRRYDVAFGEYRINTDELALRWCGRNA